MKNLAKGKPSADAMHSWLSVVRVYHLCDALMSQRLAAIGVKLAEHEVLVNLLTAPGLTQQQLAQRCFVAKSGISMLITRLAKAGLVQRQADAVDARMWRLSLTPAGRALAERSRQVQAEVVTAMTQGSSAAEQKAIAATMQRASATLEGMLNTRPRQRGRYHGGPSAAHELP